MSDKVYISNVILRCVKCCTWGSSHASCVCLWKTHQISFPLSFSQLLFICPYSPLTLFSSVDHVWKYLLTSILYSQEDFLQDVIENNWNKPQWHKMLSDGTNTKILLMSWDTAQISETMKDIHLLTMHVLQWLPVLQSLQWCLEKQTTWNPSMFYYWLLSVLY